MSLMIPAVPSTSTTSTAPSGIVIESGEEHSGGQCQYAQCLHGEYLLFQTPFPCFLRFPQFDEHTLWKVLTRNIGIADQRVHHHRKHRHRYLQCLGGKLSFKRLSIQRVPIKRSSLKFHELSKGQRAGTTSRG